MKNILLFLFLFSFSALLAQDENTTHQVVLKDGNFLRGEIISPTDSDPLIIKTFSGAEISIPSEHIEKIVFIDSNQKVLNDGRTISKSKNYNILMMGLMPKIVELWDGKDVRFGFNAVHFSKGYQFNRFLGLGGGVNYDIYDLHVIAVHAEARGYLMDRTVSPYYLLQAGYGFISPIETDILPNDTELKGGLMVHPAIGLRFATRKNTNILLEVGYRFQKTTREWENWDKYVDKITYRRLSLRFGMTF